MMCKYNSSAIKLGQGEFVQISIIFLIYLNNKD